MHLLLSLTVFTCGVVLAGSTCERPDNNQQPVIGIITQAWNEPDYPATTTIIAASYVKLLEMAGARVVPVFVNDDPDYFQFLFDRLNGILIPGGEVDITDSPYATASAFFYNKSIELYDSTGELFPIFGICLGFEELMTQANKGVNPTSYLVADNVLLPLDFTQYAIDGSWVFREAPRWIMEIFANKNVTANFHHYSVSTSTFVSNANINSVFNMLSTNIGESGEEFVSMAEGIKYPFIATQFHPEKNIFEWNPTCNLAHSLEGVAVSTYLSNAFVELTRQSCHKFESLEVLDKLLIYNYNPLYTKEYFTQTYVFEHDI
jgi:gamma-glutamyl hydrolase